MDRIALAHLSHEIWELKDASTIDTTVKSIIQKHLGPTSDNLKKLSDIRKFSAIRMLNSIIKVLEYRLSNKPTIDVVETRNYCKNYMERLCGKTFRLKYLKSQCGMLPCFEYWGMLETVEEEGNKILEEINKLSSKRSRGERLLPIPGQKNTSHDAAYSVLYVSAAFLRVWWSRRSRQKEEEGGNEGVVYTDNILDLVREMDPWFSYINQDDKIQEWVATFLCKCTISLVDERQPSREDVAFCKQTFELLGKAASMNEQKMLEFGRGICASFFSKKDDPYFSESSLLVCLLENMAIQYKAHPKKEHTLNIFLELAGYCTVEYGEASANECIKLASFFHTLSDKYFSEVHFSDIYLIIEHYALAAVVSHSDSYKKWPNPKFSKAFSIGDILTQLEPHLQEFNHIYLKTHTKFPAFLCDQITKFILSNYKEMIPANENSINLPRISEFLGRFMELGVSTICESETTEHMIKLAKRAVASFILLMIVKEDTKGFLDKLKKDGKFQTALLTNFYKCLREVFQPLYESDKVDQAIETLQLCCEASWMRASLFCDMVGSSEYGVPGDCVSEDGIVDIVNEASADSALLLKIIHQHPAKDVDSKLRSYIERWLLAQEKFQILSPAALVREWVTIKCQNIDGNPAYLAQTINSLVPSLRNSEKHSCIIMVQELLIYRNMQNVDPEFLKRMKNHIQDSISMIKKSRKHIIDRFKFLIKCGMQLGSRGHKGQLDCIRYITEAVNLLLKCRAEHIAVFNADELFRLLPNAYFLLSLLKRLVFPMKKDYTQDIKSGLKLYQKGNYKFSDTECTLFSCILDLLSIEGNMELQCEVYKIMAKRCGRNLKEFLGIALQSGNLHHALCSSPVNGAFLDMMQGDFDSSSDDVSFWRTCLTSTSLEAGAHQSLSVLPTLSYLELDADTHAAKAQETIEKVKCAARSLITGVCETKNLFAAARHYYNLAEIMIDKGLMTEALTYANEGYRLRNELLSECFIIEWSNTYVCKTFKVHPSRLSSLGSYCVGEDVYVPTPWNILRCYLESALQTGNLHYMTGNIIKAARILHHGKGISSIQNLPVFLVGFSTALVNIYCKEKAWSLARRELKSASRALEVCSPNLCKKCVYVLQAKLDQVEGDLRLSILKSKGKNDVDALAKAKDLFEMSISKLENKEWENSVSTPERETRKEKHPVLCHSKAPCESNDDCWHCQTSIVENSSSLEKLTNLKWEVIRRRYLLSVLAKQAKCSKLEGHINEERRFLMSGIYVLMGRSTFQQSELSVSFIEELVRKNVVAEALEVEQASILYKICCFSLRHKDSSGMAMLSQEYVLMGLKMAFILSREVPKLHEKVSQILAVMYACSSKDVTLSQQQRVSAIRSAAYFHQCSIGSYFNSCFLSQDQNQMQVDDYTDLRRVLAPCSMKELEESVLVFFKSLPKLSVTILCISMLSDKSYKFLHELLPMSPNSVWLMISRFHQKIGPIVVILPVSETLTDFHYKKETSVYNGWTCPWAGEIFDQVAPVLRLVLEEDLKLINSKQGASEMMQNKQKLENIYRCFLRDFENLWLGQWKYLLLGECSGGDDLDVDVVDEISNDYRSLDSVFEGDKHCMEQLKLNYGCYIGTSGGKHYKSVKGDTNEKKCRNPVIIVTQLSTQMIPLESLPILEKQEVYRMPSVGSILRSASKNRNVDPRNCYYLIIPDEDMHLARIIKYFTERCETFHIEGNAGSLVKIGDGELKKALEAHDLFVYVGHGDGRQYIPGNEIRKISDCCAVILMGCCSGYVSSKYYPMDSASLDYLLAGSPVVAANLWSVCSLGVQPFLETLFETWIKVTKSKLVECKSHLKKRKCLCKHGITMGSSMAKAREACNLRYLEGATTVIYGIPTRIAMGN